MTERKKRLSRRDRIALGITVASLVGGGLACGDRGGGVEEKRGPLTGMDAIEATTEAGGCGQSQWIESESCPEITPWPK